MIAGVPCQLGRSWARTTVRWPPGLTPGRVSEQGHRWEGRDADPVPLHDAARRSGVIIDAWMHQRVGCECSGK